MAISELEEHVGYWLRMVSNQVHAQFLSNLEREKVTVAEWVVLRKLFGRENWSQIDLVEATGLTRGAISKLVDRLKTKKLLVVSSSSNDRRVHQLKLSALGKRMVPKISVLADSNDNDFFGCLSSDERRFTIKLMKKIIESKKIKKLPLE